MKCVSGKRAFENRQLAEEALIAARSNFVFRDDAGPVGVYQCDDCGAWHLTSKGPKSNLLNDPDIKDTIRKQQEAEYWRQKFKN